MSLQRSTYGKMAKGLKWSSLFIVLIPIAILIMSIMAIVGKMPLDSCRYVSSILDFALLALSVIWFILIIIMFFAAGSLKGIASPLKTRIGLLVSLALVFAPLIVSLLSYYPVNNPIINPYNMWGLLVGLWISMPLIIVIGYLVSFFCARSAQHKSK